MTGATRNKLLLILCAMAGAGCSAPVDRSAALFTADGRVIALGGGEAGARRACFTCHGLDGRGDGAGTPRLAGLDPGYLARQMENYANGLRRHAEMELIAKRLSAADRQKVAFFYAGLDFAPAAASPGPAPRLWSVGDSSRGLQPCADCHGAAGEGVGAGNPALGGQPALYLAAQMEKWRTSERRGDPDNLMLEISRRLSADEVAALARFAAALPGRALRPAPPGPSPEALRPGPRNDVSGRRPHEAAP